MNDSQVHGTSLPAQEARVQFCICLMGEIPISGSFIFCDLKLFKLSGQKLWLRGRGKKKKEAVAPGITADGAWPLTLHCPIRSTGPDVRSAAVKGRRGASGSTFQRAPDPSPGLTEALGFVGKEGMRKRVAGIYVATWER